MNIYTTYCYQNSLTAESGVIMYEDGWSNVIEVRLTLRNSHRQQPRVFVWHY